MQLLAFLTSRKGKLEDAQALMAEALRSKPDAVEAYWNHAGLLMALRRPGEALASLDRGIALDPGVALAHDNRGKALLELRRPEEALASFDRALAIKPDFAGAHNNRGVVFRGLGRAAEALASFDRVIALQPDYAGAHNNRGNSLRDLKRPDDALASFDRAILLRPNLAEAHSNRGYALRDLKRADEALASFDCAHRAQGRPCGGASWSRPRARGAEAARRGAPELRPCARFSPSYADAHVGRGNVLFELARPVEAAAAFSKALALNPEQPFAFGLIANAARHACDFAMQLQVEAELEARIDKGKALVPPFALLGYPVSASTQSKAARKYARHRVPFLPEPLWRGTLYRHQRIRIAYLSGDFLRHATAYLTAGLFELHDRSRFEVHGISLGPMTAARCAEGSKPRSITSTTPTP